MKDDEITKELDDIITEKSTSAEKLLIECFKYYKKTLKKRTKKKIYKKILEQYENDPEARKEWIKSFTSDIIKLLRKIKKGEIVHLGDAEDLELVKE